MTQDASRAKCHAGASPLERRVRAHFGVAQRLGGRLVWRRSLFGHRCSPPGRKLCSCQTAPAKRSHKELSCLGDCGEQLLVSSPPKDGRPRSEEPKAGGEPQA
jgi:hypothetical protein